MPFMGHVEASLQRQEVQHWWSVEAGDRAGVTRTATALHWSQHRWIETSFTRDLRIGNFRSNRIANRIGGYDSNSNRISNLESNQDVVVYVFNADYHSSCVGLLRTRNRDVPRILLVPQTILHDRSHSASECVCSSYINIKS